MTQKKIVPSIKVIIKHNNRYLLIQNKDGTFDIPGGRVKYGESNMETLQRELMEEIGLKIDTKKLKLFRSWHYVSRSKNIHFVYVVYIYKLPNFMKLEHKEGHNLVWFNKKDIACLKLPKEFKHLFF